MNHRNQLRNRIRNRRRQLPPEEQLECAEQLAGHICRDPLVTSSRRIAAYLAEDGELDPLPLMQHLWSLGKTIYLPVLLNFNPGKLGFAAYTPGDSLVPNRFGILEPEYNNGKKIKPTALDLVLTPLVAFDDRGHRLGMGGGYYDRSFAFLNHRRHWHKPRLLGLGYEFQKLDAIKAASWDVALHAVATESRLYRFEPG